MRVRIHFYHASFWRSGVRSARGEAVVTAMFASIARTSRRRELSDPRRKILHDLSLPITTPAGSCQVRRSKKTCARIDRPRVLKPITSNARTAVPAQCPHRSPHPELLLAFAFYVRSRVTSGVLHPSMISWLAQTYSGSRHRSADPRNDELCVVLHLKILHGLAEARSHRHARSHPRSRQ